MTKRDTFRIVTLLLIWFAAIYPVLPEMVRDWNFNSDNSHGFIVPLITLYLLWQKRNEMQSVRVSTQILGGVFLVSSLIVYVASYAGGSAFPARIALVFSLFGLVWFCLGTD